MTNGPPGAGKAGFPARPARRPSSRIGAGFNFRHNQRSSPTTTTTSSRTCGSRSKSAYSPDRYFIEEYYKRLFDTGHGPGDPRPTASGRRTTSPRPLDRGQPENWYTDTQWLPRVDYYRLGDSFFDNLFTYYQHSGADYATITTDIMVNNPNLFAFMPYDPISNTTGTFSAGRFYTNHELDMPLNFGNVVRLVPYVQGQVVGWTDQLGGGPLGHSPSGPMGRAWGGAASAPRSRPGRSTRVESELLNVHGLNNKISLFVDARAAFSNVRLNNIAVQDDLDDNTYEFVRRYLASRASRAASCRSPTIRGT